jgi:hypothetical protein
MIRKFSLLLLLFFSSFNLFAQDYYDVHYVARDTTQSKISAIAYWNKKESHTFRFTQKELKYTADTVSSEKIQNDYEMRFNVIDSTEKSYKIRWDFMRSLKKKDQKVEEQENLIMSQLYDKYKDLQLVYTTDELGAMDKIEDLPKLTAMMDEIVNLLKKPLFDTTKFESQKKRKQFEEYMSVFLNKDYILKKTFLEPITQFHNLMGFSCYLNDTLSFKMKAPNSIDGGLITYDGYLFIESIDSTGEVQFIQELYPDEEQVNKMTFDFLNKTIGKGSKELKDLEKTTMFGVNDYNRYFIDLDKGIPTFVKTIRETYIKNKVTEEQTLQKQDILIIELIE